MSKMSPNGQKLTLWATPVAQSSRPSLGKNLMAVYPQIGQFRPKRYATMAVKSRPNGSKLANPVALTVCFVISPSIGRSKSFPFLFPFLFHSHILFWSDNAIIKTCVKVYVKSTAMDTSHGYLGPWKPFIHGLLGS